MIALNDLRTLVEGYRLVAVWPERLVLGLIVAILALWIERRMESGWRLGLWRALIALLIGAALVRPSLEPGGGLPRIWLIDDSSSVQGEGARLAEELPATEALVTFGDDAHSPIAEAIDLAVAAMPAGGKLILVSDGGATAAMPQPGDSLPNPPATRQVADPFGDALDAAVRARNAGVTLDALQLQTDMPRDLAVEAIDLPPAIRLGDSAAIRVHVLASEPITGQLKITAGGRELLRRKMSFESAALRRVEIASIAPREEGLVQIRVEVEAEAGTSASGGAASGGDRQRVPDARPDNDRLDAALHVLPPLSALVVGDGPDAVGFADLLAADGVQVTVLAPERLPGRLSELDDWDALALVDVPASALGLDQMAALEAFVADLGRGLLLSGGRQSYLSGGWENSLLEDLAPLRLDTPDRAQRDPVALLLLIDQSASMGSVEGRGAISKLALAREAALLAAEVLHPGDRLGVVTYDEGARWLVPMVEVGVGRELVEIESALSGLATGGGTSILSALQLGMTALADLEVLETRHALLLSDGRDFNTGIGAYVEEVSRARERGVTLSTIAIGTDADQELLARLARVGRGRFHSAADPSDLPRLAVEESEIVRARAQQLGSYRAAPPAGGPHPLLFGTALEALPPLTGYLAMRPREGARVVLELPGGDPLLTAWNYGLGRVVAWTSDLGEEWAGAWPEDEAGSGLWARSLRYAARSPDAGPPGVTLRAWPGSAQIELDLLDDEGRTVDLGEASLAYTRGSGEGQLRIPQTGPGRYAATMRLESPETVPAFVRVAADGERWSVPVTLASGHPPETLPQPRRTGWLQALVDAGGGELLDLPPGEDEISAVAKPSIELWPWLLGIAALLWLVEVTRQMAGLRIRLPLRRRRKADA